MPTVKGKKYPYTKTGRAKAAKKSKTATANKKLKSAGLKLDNSGKKVATLKANERLAYAKALGAQRAAPKKVAGQAARSKKAKWPSKKATARTPAQIARIKAGMRNAKRKRKAGKGYQK